MVVEKNTSIIVMITTLEEIDQVSYHLGNYTLFLNSELINSFISSLAATSTGLRTDRLSVMGGLR